LWAKGSLIFALPFSASKPGALSDLVARNIWQGNLLDMAARGKIRLF
jgi:hypothetical protein